jgi:segregation and condensation protein A
MMEFALPEFEGPLDLLLALIRKNQYSIEDLPVAEITSQYLEYMRQAEGRLNLDLSADFAYMASTLIHIKSCSLLASDPELARREPAKGSDQKAELIRQLLDRERILAGAEFLRQRLEAASGSWSRASGSWGDGEPEQELASSLPHGRMSLLDVVRLAKHALETARQAERDASVMPAGLADGPTIEEMMAWVESRLPEDNARAKGNLLLLERNSRGEQSVLFLALLELAKSERLRITQPEPFAEWMVERACGTCVP